MSDGRPRPTDPAAFRLALGILFLNGLGFGLLFPVAAYAVDAFGTSPALVTALVALHPVARVVAAPRWGRWSDRVGRRPVLLAGTALTAAGHLLFALSPGLTGLAVARIATGLGAGDSVAAVALVADVTAPEDRPAALGQLRAAQGLGMLLGPVLGGALGVWSLRAPAAVAAVISLAAMALAFRAQLPPPVPAATVADPVPRMLLAVGAACAMAVALAEAVVPFAVRDVLVPSLLPSTGGAAAADAAVVLVVAILLGFGLSLAATDVFLSGRLVRRFGSRVVTGVALAAWALAFAATPPVYRAGLGFGALALVGAAVPAALAGTGLTSWVSGRTSAEGQGAALGALAGAAAVGEAAGPLIAGLLYQQWFGAPYVVSAAVLGVAAVAVWRFRGWRP